MNIIASNRPFPNRVVEDPKELSLSLQLKPEYVFFPFWSWKVPKEITDGYNCIGFHTGSVGGGSPIQNQIRKGCNTTYLRMFYMEDTIDGGKTIDSEQISLLGSLEEITIRMTKLMEMMIEEFQENN